jgi:hypothetical protein
MLTQKGREPFIRMKLFLDDENAVHKLVASQYKIAPDKLMRTGNYSGQRESSDTLFLDVFRHFVGCIFRYFVVCIFRYFVVCILRYFVVCILRYFVVCILRHFVVFLDILKHVKIF